MAATEKVGRRLARIWSGSWSPVSSRGPIPAFVPVLEQFLGSSASLSPATVTRLTQQWQADHAAVVDRDFAEVDYVYGWADGIHLNVRLE